MRKILFIIILLATPVFFTHAAAPIKILLVPGHDNEVWGAQYGNLKEAAMNLAIAERMYKILKKDKRFEVHITRDTEGYTKEFSNYFSNYREYIIAFKEYAKKVRQNDLAAGTFIEKENVPHLDASEEVAIKLYGINKWANDHDVDAVIHIHFNDYPRAQSWLAGKYKGFAIYMPEEQMVNSKESDLLAADIFKQLRKKYITSTYEGEKGGLIPDQNLIALGSNGTLLSSVRSVLIEYGYIYRFGDSKTRPKTYDDMAARTVTGIKNYFR